MEIRNVTFGGGLSMVLTPVASGLFTAVTNIVEGNSFTITFTTNKPGAFGYTITGVSSEDIGNASLTGTFTANGETRTYTVSDDAVAEGAETFVMSLDNGQARAPVIINDAYYNLTANVSSANEGNVFRITLDTNAIHALPLGYTITGVSNVDFNGSPSLTGNFTSNGQVLTYTANLDSLTEGTEYFAISLNNGRANANITINDTSITLPGQQEYTVAGTYSWIAPTGVSNVSVVVVGAGGSGGAVYQPGEPGGGGGGALAWGNATVTPGQSYTVVVGAGGPPPVSYYQPGVAGGYSAFGSNVIYAAGGDRSIGYTANGGNVIIGQGGGYGGSSTGGYSTLAGGAGAGGYSGNGGNGSTGAGTSGSGGGGGGGGTSRDAAAGGGGVGIYGAGSSGAGGDANYYGPAVGGYGGSGGQNAANVNDGSNASAGGRFGGGGGTGRLGNGKYSANGAGGAVRIVWGAGRYYPSTNTANV